MKRKQSEQILRGQIYYANLDPSTGSEQGGTRPVLIVQNNIGNRFSPTTVVAPITTELKKVHQPTHIHIPPHFGIPHSSMAMLEQLRTIDKSRLKNFVGCLDDDVMDYIDKALCISVGLSRSIASRDQDGTEQRDGTVEETILTLCPVCLDQFIHSSEHIVKKVDRAQMKERCVYCNVRDGYDYRIICRKKRMGDDRY